MNMIYIFFDKETQKMRIVNGHMRIFASINLNQLKGYGY